MSGLDKIHVNKMEFYGYHGVFPEETRLGQRFIVDLVVETDLRSAGLSDALENSINYAELYKVTKDILEGKPYKLLEAIAEKLAAELLGQFEKIERLTVKIIKPDPPIPGHYKSVAVEITRGRK